jgi:TonB-dependent receptor
MQRRSTKLYQHIMLVSASALALSAAASSAFAQEAAASPAAPAAATDDNAVDEVVVTGVRASLRSAQAIKRDASQLVDSIVATDIGKLPDHNVAEALQRIPGIQIDRQYGEGSSIAIRGLTQVRTEINGRDSFTANGGRALSFEDVPSELLAGVDVYKNPAADLIEGGIGGLVNLRTRMPFDFSGAKFAGTVSATNYDFADKTKPSASALVSDRWDTKIGEIGVLANISYQKGAFRQDTVSTEPYYTSSPGDANYVAFPGRVGQASTVPHGGGIDTTIGSRERKGAALAVQWRPNDKMEFYGQLVHSDYHFTWQDNSLFAFSSDTNIAPLAGSTYTYTADGDFTSGSFQNVPVNSNTSFTRRHSTTDDYSLGGKWQATEDLVVSTDFQYIHAITDGTRSIAILSTDPVNNPSAANTFTQDLRGDVPKLSIGPAGFLTNAASFDGAAYLDHIEKSIGTEKAWRADAEYTAPDGGFLKSAKVGVRYTDRTADSRSSNYNYTSLGNVAANNPSLLEVNQFDNFFNGEGGILGPVLAFKKSIISNYAATLKALGVTGVSYNPSNYTTQNEKSYAAYAVARFGFDAGSFPVDGNLGIRIVRTELSSDGFASLTPFGGTTTYSAVNVDSSYTAPLPSLNVRVHLTDDLQLRFAAAKAISRPDFSQLNPTINVSERDKSKPLSGTLTASSGNPNLKPMKADQFDSSLEWYFNSTGMLYGSVFYKKVDGFIATTTQQQTYFGDIYTVSTPVNGDNGKIKGLEVGYTQFYDFLPGLLSGLGMQANYTYVDSEAPSPAAADKSGNKLTVPLEGLSKNSYNLVGMYEKGPFSARVAYNWRDDYVVTTQGNGTGNLPVVSKAFGQLDASVSYDFNDHMGLTIEGTNLTNTQRDTIFGKETRLRDSILVDRKVAATLHVNF